MSHVSIDHIYRETSTWETSIQWWQSLGFTIADSWGSDEHRGTRLTLDDATVVLAEISNDSRPADSVVLSTDDLAALSHRTGHNIVVSHWGTSLIAIEDPNGNRYIFETRNEDG